MRVDILTFHCADNYGAMLQAYALQQALRGLGCDVEFVNYAPPRVTYRYWLLPWFPTKKSFNPHAMRVAWRRLKIRLRGLPEFRARRRNMAAFRQARLAVSRPRLLRGPQIRKRSADMLLLGSDQIWNPECSDGLCPAFFGVYRGSHVRRVISYAASLGRERVEPRDEARFRKWIQSVDAVSLREKGALPFLREVGRDAAVCCDPALLIPAEVWAKIAIPPPDMPYIYVYLFQRNEEMERFILKLRERTGLRLLVHHASFMRRWREDTLEDRSAGPAEFLGAIANARYVVTNSFHGTAFSAIFHRDFISFPHLTRGLRMLNLLDELGLSDRVGGAGHPNDIDASVDWSAVDARLSAMADESLNYLRRQLALCEEQEEAPARANH